MIHSQAIVTSAAFVPSRFDRLCKLSWIKEDKSILGIARHKHVAYSKQAVAYVGDLSKIIQDTLCRGSKTSSIVHVEV